MKVLTIVGARPQFIKAAMLSEALKDYPDIKEVLVHTGQHYDKNMSDIFFEQLNIPSPKHHLGIGGGTQGEQTGKMIVALEKTMIAEQPDMVIVYGDTNSTLAGALAAAKLHLPVAHIEAGFRCHDKTMPEEINRVVTDHISTLLFCPTRSAVEELKKEGLTRGVHFTGDIMYDATLFYSQQGNAEEILKQYSVQEREYLFATIHRAANTDDKRCLKDIFDSLINAGETVLLPLHPRTRKKLHEYGLWEGYQEKNIIFTSPTNYVESLTLIKNAKKIITDSGGVLREAYFLKKTCIILRDTIEFVEAVQSAEATLVGTDRDKIRTAIASFEAKGAFVPFFGKGNTARAIIEHVQEQQKKGTAPTGQ